MMDCIAIPQGPNNIPSKMVVQKQWWLVGGWAYPSKMLGIDDWLMRMIYNIMTGWWLSLPLWKMMGFVSWDDETPNWMEKKSCSKPPTSNVDIVGYCPTTIGIHKLWWKKWILRAGFDQEKWWYSFIYNWDTVGLIRWWFMATMVYSRSCHHQGLLVTVRTWFWSCHLITMLNGCVLVQRVVLPKKLADKSINYR